MRLLRELVYGLQDGLSGRIIPWEGARCSATSIIYGYAYDASLILGYCAADTIKRTVGSRIRAPRGARVLDAWEADVAENGRIVRCPVGMNVTVDSGEFKLPQGVTVKVHSAGREL
jgi:hypothetical protein